MSRQRIVSADIADGTIVAADLANYTLTNLQIAPNTITNDKIGDNQIQTEKISNGTLTASDMANADHRGLGMLYADDLNVILPGSPGQGIIRMGNAGAAYLYYNGSWVVTPALPGSQIAAGSIDSARLASQSVFQLLWEGSMGEQWVNQGLGAGYNGFPGYPQTVLVPSGTSFIMIFYAFNVLVNAPTLPQVCHAGWTMSVQNVAYRHLSRHSCQSLVVNDVTASGAVYIPPAAWGGGTGGNVQFGPQFYCQIAIPDKCYLRGTSQPATEYAHMQIVACKGGI